MGISKSKTNQLGGSEYSIPFLNGYRRSPETASRTSLSEIRAREGDALKILSERYRPELQNTVIGEFFTIASAKAEKFARQGYLKCTVDKFDQARNFDDFIEFKDIIIKECERRGIRCEPKHSLVGFYFQLSWG